MKFYLYPYCQPINGKDHSVILNLQGGSYTTIPNSLFKILNTKKNNFVYDMNELIAAYGNKEIINSYFDFLCENQIGRYHNGELSFKAINKKWEYPGTIRNTIISIKENSTFDVFEVINKCIDLGSSNLELRLDLEKPFIFLENIAKKLRSSSLSSITCFIKNGSNADDYENLTALNPKLTKVVLMGQTEIIPVVKESNVRFSKEEYNENKNAFITDKFFIDLNFYLESLTYNPFLNKKVYISPEGDIKNDSYYEENFGNIHNTPLEKIVNLASFQYLWKINNDKIKELKDNPMRYSILPTGIIKKLEGNIYSISNN